MVISDGVAMIHLLLLMLSEKTWVNNLKKKIQNLYRLQKTLRSRCFGNIILLKVCLDSYFIGMPVFEKEGKERKGGRKEEEREGKK